MVPTADYVNIQVDAAVNVKVGSDSNKLELAAQNFLNQNSDYMARVREVLEEICVKSLDVCVWRKW